MIRNALLALDGSAASDVALKMAIQFVQNRSEQAKQEKGEILLTGVAVLDRPTITKREAMPAGAAAFKKERDEAWLAEADEKTRRILDNFRQRCQSAGVAHDCVRAEGVPYEAIAAESHRHDLVLIGRNTNFQFQTSNDRCETFRHLLRDHPRPVVVTPSEIPSGDAVMIAYGGSRAASRALHMFALMEFELGDLEVHVVSVDKKEEVAEANCKEAVELLRRHDIAATANPIVTNQNVAQALLDQAGKLNARLIVMGAFGRKGIQKTFFGSSTRKMLEQSACPLFLY